MVCVTVVHFVNQVASGLEHQTLKCPPPVCLMFALLLFLLHCAQTKNWNAPTAHKLCIHMYHHLSEVHSTLYACVASHTLNSKSLPIPTIYSLLCVFLLLHGDRWMLLAMLPTWLPRWGTSSWRQWFVWWRVCVAWQPIPALNMFMKRWHSSARCWRRWRRHNMP